MENSFRFIVALVFGLLVIGGFFTIGGGNVPVVEQITNPEGSVLEGTDDQLAQLTLAVVGIVLALGGMGVGLAATVWFLNREVNKSQSEEDKPVDIPMLGSGDGTGAAIPQNAFMILVSAGLVTVLVVLAVAFYASI